MAYALVGSIGTVTASGAPSFAQSTTAGNLLIAWVGSSSGVTITVSGTGWVQAVQDGANSSAIFYKANCSAGETAPSFSPANASLLGEFSGGATSSPVDQTGSKTGTSSPIVATTAAADAALGELVVTAGFWNLSKSGTVTTADSYNNGATPTSNLNSDASSAITHYRFAWGTTTGNSSADSDSQSNNSMNISSASPSGLSLASFRLFSGYFPRNPAININDPAFV